jgi:hypothetical protein
VSNKKAKTPKKTFKAWAKESGIEKQWKKKTKQIHFISELSLKYINGK